MTRNQYFELFIGTIMFLLFFGYVRNMILGNPISSEKILITTGLFFLWYLLTKCLTDFFSQNVGYMRNQ